MSVAAIKGGFSFETSFRGQSDTWLTPPYIYRALGEFDLDPCAQPSNPTAKRLIVLPEDGLAAEWEGRVWLNPPYGPATKHWLEKLENHGFGTALVLSRTDTKWFHKAMQSARAVLFFEGRIEHLKPGLVRDPRGSGATCGSVLIAFGEYDAEKLLGSYLKGWRVRIR